MASATLIALFLLSALTFYAPSTTARFVKDVDGNIVKNGGRFYILPSLIGALEGGVRLSQTDNEPFPLSVVLSPFKDDKGLPVTISALIPTTYLHEGPVFLSFEYTPEWTAVPGFPEVNVLDCRSKTVLKKDMFIQT
ncbi:chymotrypsin inhibitor 3-like [Vigna radiata var. radiata]|uniref:Chymotrypsin inhibitor 3-like n=1 Tax=Vigna radiata var. radiata TaxID=3916 RepID=A0A1S3UZS1_VIGRR|nr:chymotrypsin inhibitor 3-like [Vigna radiata var. radiata]